MYNQTDLINACHSASYPIDLTELELKVAWSNSREEFALLFEQIDCYYTERGFSAGCRYEVKYLETGVIPDGRQQELAKLLLKFNTEFEMDLRY